MRRVPSDYFLPAAGEANRWYAEFARIAATLLKRGEDYEVDEKKRTVGILESGIDKVEDHLGVKNLYESKNTPLIGFLNNSIKAKELFTNNKDYVVIDGEVLIVDEHTGRILPAAATTTASTRRLRRRKASKSSLRTRPWRP